jgi:hypothetical protein
MAIHRSGHLGRILGLTGALAAACYTHLQPMPEGTSFEGEAWPSEQVEFLADLTWTDTGGERHVEQTIFDEVFEIIAGAERFLLVDMFLYNDFQGEVREQTRALADELTRALIERKRAVPALGKVCTAGRARRVGLPLSVHR